MQVARPRRFTVSVIALVLAACTSAPVPSATTVPSATPPGPSAKPTLVAPSSAPATPDAPADRLLLTQVPPGADLGWLGITWRKLDTDDPLAQVRSIVAWRGGYVAIGAPIRSGASSMTPVWTSADGGAWQRLGPEVFGPTSLVLGVAEAAGGLVALTLAGGPNPCGIRADDLFCWTPAPPLLAWTSPDGMTWTQHPGPDIELDPLCEGCGVAPLTFRAGETGLALFGLTTALSSDGVTWDVLKSSGLPIDDDAQGTVVAFGSRFVTVGERNIKIGDEGGTQAIGYVSEDGRSWAAKPMVIARVAEHGTGAHGIVAGPAGLIATGGTAEDPGAALWWSSLDGSTWTELVNYPPLGTWHGEGQG
ncbi:MAG: hypothetical protein M3P84_10785, partial [Chloroflexota bacterium]|nr:hypothetical protein [Chloroflexota bacterium]